MRQFDRILERTDDEIDSVRRPCQAHRVTSGVCVMIGERHAPNIRTARRELGRESARIAYGGYGQHPRSGQG